MASLFLGKVGDGGGIFEIHAVTNGQPFRELTEQSVSDPALFKKILEGRYQLLCSGNPIYCTAVNPIKEENIEYSPHDDREGTIHIVALGSDGQVEAALGVAVDVCDKENGTYIGLPLENRWRSGIYPVSRVLDDFRMKYVRLNRGMDRNIEPYEMAELYRHYKRFGTNNALARLGLYRGCYHLLVREACLKRKMPTRLWVFDSIAQYFNIYRYAGAAVLRDYTITTPPRFVSPAKKKLVASDNSINYEGEVVSRNVLVPIPRAHNSSIRFEKKEVPFLDGLVDLSYLQNAIDVDPVGLSPVNFEGFMGNDKSVLASTINLLMRRAFLKVPKLPTGKSGKEIVWSFSKVGI